MPLALATAAVGLVISLPLVLIGVEEAVAYNVTAALLSTVAALTGAYLGARPADSSIE